MPGKAQIVEIVVDPEFGERLLSIDSGATVWIADTPVNRPVAESVWSSIAGAGSPSITTFKVDRNKTPEQWCRGILPSIDLHHGQYSQTPAYSIVDVIGAGLTPELREAFAEYGFASFAERSDGFRATSSITE